MLKKIKQAAEQNKQLKAFLLLCIMPKGQSKPRLWVKLFLNPFLHKKGKGATICRRTRLDVLPFNRFELGKNSTIEDFATVNNGLGDVLIGENTRIGLSNVLIGPIQIGDNVILAQHVVLSAMNHGYMDIAIPIKDQACTKEQIVIEDEVWIGANVLIASGVNIGKHSVVAGGSVVLKNVAPYTVVGGNPAKLLKQYNTELGVWERVKA